MGAPQLLITDAVETVSWDGTDAWLMRENPFVWSTPTLRPRIFAQPGIDGAEQDTTDFDNVAETIFGKFIGGQATVRAAVARLERLLNHARQYNRPGIAPVYLKLRPDSSEAYYRSQVLSGRVLWDKLALDYQWVAGEFDITVVLTRRFFWEADAEVELPLKRVTVSESYATGGKTIYNHEDATAGHTNAVEINTSVVAGDLPAPLRLVMTNASAGTYAGILASLEVEQVGPVPVVLEGEASLPLSNQADALSSGGNFNRIMWPSAAETDLLSWSTQLTSAMLVNAAGRFFRVVVRFATTPTYTDLWLRLKLTNAAGTLLQTSKLLLKSGLQVQELGALQLPPSLMQDAAFSTLTLVLQATRTANGLSPVNIASSTAANPSVVTTATAHGFATGQAVTIAGHLVNTSANGNWIVTVLSTTTFSIPVLGNGVGGATGTAAQAAVLDVDFLQLLPLDGWRKYVPAFGGIAVSDALVDDQNRDSLRTVLSGGTVLKNYTAQGAPLMVVPGPFMQRLRFLWQRSTGVAVVDDLLTVQAFYRPRRLTI